MALQKIIRTIPLNLLAAATGIAGTLFISWKFGLEVFAIYTINLAKLSIILLGLEILPSSFSIFRQQSDSAFKIAYPTFYLLFSIISTLITITLIHFFATENSSWFMASYIFLAVMQRYFDCQSQANGIIGDYFWIPAITNTTRLFTLIIQTQLFENSNIHDLLWSSLTIGMVAGQLYMGTKFPNIAKLFFRPPKKELIIYLLKIRKSYYPYYLNSVLKRAKDIYIPIFCDAFLTSKSEIGRFLLYQKSVDFSCTQIRMIEGFLTNIKIRSSLAKSKKNIIITSAIIGQITSIAISALLTHREGLGWNELYLAAIFSFYIYPYVLEIFWRSDSYAKFLPLQVSISLICYLVTSAVFLSIAAASNSANTFILISGMITSQTISAISYLIAPKIFNNSKSN